MAPSCSNCVSVFFFGMQVKRKDEVEGWIVVWPVEEFDSGASGLTKIAGRLVQVGRMGWFCCRGKGVQMVVCLYCIKPFRQKKF